MKFRVLTILLVLISTGLSAQITINSSDLPSAGDTFRVSNGLILPTIDPAPTGTNFTWDFSTLQWVTQDVDTFLSVSSTGAIYSVAFVNIPINPYRANQAVVGPDLPSLPQISITDVYYFYYNSTGSYDLKGYGAKINGFSTPIPFNNLDRVLDLPVNYGNIDSSDSDYSLSVPTLGGYFHTQRRVNEADGWGTLITPYGTFDALRVKSVITGRDSLDLDTLGGFGFQLPVTTEYKWYGINQGIPLLQINTTTTFGFEVVSSIVYRDSVRDLTSSIPSEIPGNGLAFSVYPNPAAEGFMVETDLIQDETAEILLTDIYGRTVKSLYQGTLPSGTSRLLFSTDGLAKGIYLISLQSGSQKRVERILIQ